jgi:hypothetical protein
MSEPVEANPVTRFVLCKRAKRKREEGETGQEKSLKKSK